MDVAASILRSETSASRPFWQRLAPVHVALLLVILSVVVRAVGLGSRPLWLDEAYSAWFSARDWRELWTVVPTYEPHPPFYYSILKLWRQLVGGDAIALRSFSLILGVLTVPVVIAAIREQERQTATGQLLLRIFVGALLVACSPMLVMLDQEARPYPLMVFAYAVAILGLLRLMGEFTDGGTGRPTSWLLLGLGTELILWAHALGILFAFCLFLALAGAIIAAARDRARLIRAGATTGTVAMLYLPCLWMIASRTGDWGTGWLRWDPWMLIGLLGLYSVPIEALTIASFVAAVIMLVLARRALSRAFARPGWTADKAMILLWLGPPLLAASISALFMPVFLARTLSASLIPACLAMAGAAARATSARERRRIAAGLFITLVPSAIQIALRPAPEPWDEVSAYLQRHVQTGDQVWLYPNDSALPLALAAKGASHSYPARGIPRSYPAIGFKGPIRAGPAQDWGYIQVRPYAEPR